MPSCITAKPTAMRCRSWACKLMQTKPFKLVAVALANKLARIAFAIMRGKTTYTQDPALTTADIVSDHRASTTNRG